MDEAVNAILDATNGHPRSMLIMFKKCTSLEQLKSCFVPIDGISVKEWLLSLNPYADIIEILVYYAQTTDRTLDLSYTAGDPDITCGDVADKALIRYEGSITDATIIVSKNILLHLLPLFALRGMQI